MSSDNMRASNLSEEDLETWILFIRSHAKIHERLAKRMQCRHQMPITWFDVLVHLYHEPNRGLRMQDLADAVVLSNSGLTRLVDRMARDGLVERRACLEDRRVTFATITDEGCRRLEEILPDHQQAIYELFASQLEPEEMAVFHRVCRRLLDSLQCLTAGSRSS